MFTVHKWVILVISTLENGIRKLLNRIGYCIHDKISFSKRVVCM